MDPRRIPNGGTRLRRIAELEAQQAKLERSRPRTPGKKGGKTRALNKIARQIRAAQGLLTKARNAIARGGRVAVRTQTRGEAKAQRSGEEGVGKAARGVRREPHR